MVAPLFGLGVFDPVFQLVLAAAWIWGVLLIVAAEWLGDRKRQAGLQAGVGYAPFLFAPGGIRLLFAAYGEIIEDRTAGHRLPSGKTLVFFCSLFAKMLGL
jgi:hypothetical protein